MVASELLARAAIMDGKQASAFPFFGSERRGAPVMAFCRIDDKPVRTHSGIEEPDYVVVLDSRLIGIVDVLKGIKDGGMVLVNSSEGPEELELDFRGGIVTVDATSIALDHGLGSSAAPIVNTAMVGAFAAICHEVSIESVEESIRTAAPAKREKNAKAARTAYESIKGV